MNRQNILSLVFSTLCVAYAFQLLVMPTTQAPIFYGSEIAMRDGQYPLTYKKEALIRRSIIKKLTHARTMMHGAAASQSSSSADQE